MKKIGLLQLLLLAAFFTTAQNWYQIPSGTNVRLNTIDFPSATVGYIGGNDSTLLKTTDGGETWNAVNFSGVTFYPGGEHIVKLQFVSETTGFMTVGPYSGSYKTTDGGQTWTLLALSSNLCYNEGLYFTDANNGFIAGSGCFQGELVDRLANGTWSAATISTSTFDANSIVTDIDLRGNIGLASSFGGRFLRTTNGGANWDTIPSSLGSSTPILSVAFVDDTLCYAGYDQNGSGFGILRSVDAGLTWAQEVDMATFFYPVYYGIHPASNGTVFVGAKPSWDDSGLIFRRTPDGVWNYDGVDQPIYELSSYADSVVFAVGDSGYIVTNVPPAQLSINDLMISPDELLAFPNPVSGILHVAGTIEPESFFTIHTTDGKLVTSGILSADGTIDCQFLKTGTYIVTLQSGKTIKTARIIRE